MRYLLPLSCLFVFANLNLPADDLNPFSTQENPKLVIQNRILAKAHGKTISVLDVVKKMDMYMSRYYPEMTGSVVNRFQFYSAQWRSILDQMIDNELILADADEKEVKVTDAESRELMMERFGPNIMANLDRIGVTYEEAKQMIYTEIAVDKMTWYRVNNKAIQTVNPQDVKAAYKEKYLNQPSSEEWKYQVLSIRSPDSNFAKAIAEKAYQFLGERKCEFTALPEVLKKDNDPTQAINITISQEFNVNSKDLSDAHKEALLVMENGTYSKPFTQVSRFDNQTVSRIYYLKEHIKKDPPTFLSIADELRLELLQAAVDKESAIYKKKLRERFGFGANGQGEMFPPDFQPFALVR